jgi:SAM-dependent methyltransferase
MSEERYGTSDDEAELERVRLGMLAAARDPKTFALLERIGVEAGMHCLELGAGAGSVSAWLAARVGIDGRVMSTDIDLQFHGEMPDNVIVRQHDIENEPLPAAHFDIVHTRAVLQHVPSRDEVVGKLVEALKPGGWMVLEDSQFGGFGDQGLEEPYRSIHQIVASGSQEDWRDPNYGLQLVDQMQRHGLTDIDVAGDIWAMRPGEPGGEWWFMALERAIPRLVEYELVTEGDGEAAMAQVRTPGFVMLSPVSIAVSGRKPVAASVAS